MLVGLHQGPAGHVALPITAGHQGELLLKGHHLLQDPVGGKHMVEQCLQCLLIGHGHGALAVVAAAAGLGHQGKAESGRQGGALLQFGRAIRTRAAPERGARRRLTLEESHRAGLRRGKHLLKTKPTRTGQVELIEQLALPPLGDQRCQGIQTRNEAHPLLAQGLQALQRHPLVLKTDRSAAIGQQAGGLDIVEGTLHHGGRLGNRRIPGPRGLNVDADAELGCRLREHQGQLAAAHDADRGEGLERHGQRPPDPPDWHWIGGWCWAAAVSRPGVGRQEDVWRCRPLRLALRPGADRRRRGSESN